MREVWFAYCQRALGGHWLRRYLTVRRADETNEELVERARKLAPAGWQVITVPASEAPDWLREQAELEERSYNLEDTARVLGIQPVTVRSYVTRGYLHPMPAFRGRARYRKDEVDRLAASPPKPGRPITTGAGIGRRRRRELNLAAAAS